MAHEFQNPNRRHPHGKQHGNIHRQQLLASRWQRHSCICSIQRKNKNTPFHMWHTSSIIIQTLNSEH
ncbi:hypothetical protein AMATHDRAFT_68531 [Amanita thiersii Skay4041]|uniref:Uncharacterized protein n=1 Tax=Amanita thiersii Skay4041 TaxID=703135 RepID=A0A2A9NFI1_9AGAR|nr:hypothetical protein AMATHDRAFT_68531 [Amanita thiersii Skay4041]